MRHGVVLLLAIALAAVARADIGPKPTSSGRTPGPSGPDVDGVAVRMAEEEVELLVRRDAPGQDRLDVRAVFRMQNDGDDVTLETGFPIGAYRNMESFSVLVDGKPVDFDVVDRGALAPAAEGSARPPGLRGRDYWYVWQATYPGHATSTHEVRYTVDIAPPFREGTLPRHRTVAAGYVLHTGAGWKGPIGKAVVTLRMGNGLSLDLLFRLRPQAGGTRHDDRIVWTFTDLEPTEDHDILVHYAETTVGESLAAAREEARSTWSGRVQVVRVLQEAQDVRLRPRTEAEVREYLDALAAIVAGRTVDGETATLPGERGGDRPAYLSDPNAVFGWIEEVCDVLEEHPGSAEARDLLRAYVELGERFLAGRLLVDGEPLAFPWRGRDDTPERRAARDASVAKRRAKTEAFLARGRRLLAGS